MSLVRQWEMDFEARKKANANIPHIDNRTLYAGSPMYYYCRLCGAEMVEPEDHIYMPPRLCVDCIREGRHESA